METTSAEDLSMATVEVGAEAAVSDEAAAATVDELFSGVCDDVCGAVLDSKMAALELREKISGDGSDSGVEFCASSSALQRALSSNSGGYASSCGGLEEHVGPASCDSSMISCCSDTNICEVTGKVSLLSSVSSSGGGGGTLNGLPLVRACSHEGSEGGGSESSSVTGGPVTAVRKTPPQVKKKVALAEPALPRRAPKGGDAALMMRSRSRGMSGSRLARDSSKVAGAVAQATRDRARSRDKGPPVPPKPAALTPPNRSTPIKRALKPDSLAVVSRDTISPVSQRGGGGNAAARAPSRGRTPSTPPTEHDGRWPSVGGRGSAAATQKSGSGRAGSATPETIVVKTRVGMLALEGKSSALDKYATLPRRRREKSADDLKSKSSRSNSATRGGSGGCDFMPGIAPRMSMSMRRQVSVRETTTPTLPPYPRLKKPTTPVRTRIYHEISCQTAVTGQDVADAFAGVAKDIRVDAVEMCSKSVQSDIRDREIERLEDRLRKATEDCVGLQGALSERSQKLSAIEQQLVAEREEKLAVQRELQANTERVLAMIEAAPAVSAQATGDGDSLLMLESQIHISSCVLEKQQEEINRLRAMCRNLQSDMERSLKAQRGLIQSRDEVERESYEMQEFLQDEKTALMEALRDAETDNHSAKQRLTFKEQELERLQEECRHLVRIGEQRRQENMGMQAKYGALENRSKELIVQQNSAVSSASVALSGLGVRLDGLVEQLIASYNISEQELEDVVYHNEAYTNSGSSANVSPEYETAYSDTVGGGGDGGETPAQTPQRGHSFLAAILGAIKMATATSTRPARKDMTADVFRHPQNSIIGGGKYANADDSDSTEMLDSETEPCLMMENVLEDVTLPDSHSHNLVSTAGIMLSQIVDTPADIMRHDESLHNLSQAIANRQQIERQTCMMANRSVLRQNSEQSTSEDLSIHESIAEVPSISDYCTAQSLVDQVIDVDNSVTKLLKILRIIQMDNDNCIQQLIVDKNNLQLNKDEITEKLKDWELTNDRLKIELHEASQQLMVRQNDLANSKSELQRHRAEIDRLNEDICNLSTLCTKTNKPLTTSNARGSISKERIVDALKVWRETGTLPESELISQIIVECNEIPLLKQQLLATERQLKELAAGGRSSAVLSPWKEAIQETKRQYEAIDRALETLNGIQTVVEQCPALAELQRDLENTNFQSASSIPLLTALLAGTGTSPDLNANASVTATNGTTNASTSATENGIQMGNDLATVNTPIDSTA